MSPLRFAINVADVTHQQDEHEALLIHFGTGRYFYTTGSGRDILELLERGVSVGDIVERLSDEQSPRELVEPQVMAFVEQLHEERLIVERRGEVEVDNAPSSEHPRSFAPPRLVAHADLEDLLLLDPIHDVAHQGWPAYHPDDS